MPVTQHNEWTIRPYEAGDEAGLVALFQHVFGKAMSREHWRWKFKQWPAAAENVWLATAGPDATPVFQFGGIPLRWHVQGRIREGIVLVDTMCSLDYRRRGLLTQLSRHVHAQWQQAGIAFIIALPNDQWGSRTEALGWQKLCPLQWLVRPLRPEAQLARKLRMPALRRLSVAGKAWRAVGNWRLRPDDGIDVTGVDAAGPEFDLLWQSCQAGMPLSVVRDRQWVQWRYLNSPVFHYEVLLGHRAGRPVGFAAYHMHDDEQRRIGLVAELLAVPGDPAAFSSILHALLGRLADLGAESAAVLAAPGSRQYGRLRQAGFWPSWGAFTVQLVPLAADLSLPYLRDPQNWSLAGGDFDVI